MLIDKIPGIPGIGLLFRYRFVKFSVVGLSGMIINLVALYINREVLFKNIDPEWIRLNLSLGLAIFFATINNYLWNRKWTWLDRKGKTKYGFFPQMGQYFIACGLAIGLQFVFTLLLAQFMHYLIANIISIVLAAVLNYLLNDIWTFATRKTGILL
jgi:putative flippase GtrA